MTVSTIYTPRGLTLGHWLSETAVNGRTLLDNVTLKFGLTRSNLIACVLPCFAVACR